MKKVLVISSSMRKGGNSEILAQSFAQGAKEAGHGVEFISLLGKKLDFCKGCLVCQNTEKCVIADDAGKIAASMKNADVLAFATPIYYYEMSGQLKTLLDRMNPLFPSDYAFREVYFLSAAADTDAATDEIALQGLKGWIRCFGKAKLAGKVFAGGATDVGDIKKHKALQEAKNLGLKV